MDKYKLTIVEERTEHPVGTKSFVTVYKEVCCIGYFNNEKSLAKWAKESDGELAKAEGEE